MYLKQIRISGFKSFADKVNIELKPGITGIVGPNGSGKSNIVDAVRWVLGEQSVKSLRGDATMTDVIFSGSKKRSPMSSASVTLVFDNTDHSLKVDYTEVSIKRTIYKTGENEYYLNNEKVRLKDILDLLLDSGSAKESFSIISQGDIAEVLSAKPEDRRVIFESAAGVLKYKKRKIEAEKKLDKTHDNIDRINDIINELEMQVEPLKKQSEDATLYLDTKKELESIEVSLIVDDIDKINKEYVESKSKIETLNKDIISLSTISSTNDANLSKMKSSLSTLNDTLYKKQEELVKITSLTEKLNGEKNIIGERKKYEVDDVKLHNNIISLKEEELKLNNNKDVLNNEINNLKLELDSYNKEITTVTGSFNNLINKKNDKNIKYNNFTKIVTNNEYKINVLENTIDNNDTFSFAVKNVLNNTRLTGICDALGNIINTNEKYATALDVALGASSSFIITETEKDAENAIKFLKDNSLGRVTFFPLNIIEGKYIDNNTLNTLKNSKGFIDIMSNIVTYNDSYKNIVLNQLGNIILVDNMKNANELGKIINHRYRIVTLDGEILHIGGSLTGGVNKKNGSIVLDKMELEKLLKETNNLKENMRTISLELTSYEEELDKLTMKKDALNRKIIYLSEIINIKTNELNEINNKYDEIINNINGTNNILSNNISKEEEEVLNKYYEALLLKDNLTIEINVISKNIKELSDEINTVEHDVKVSGSEYYKKQTELKNLEVKVGKFDVKLDTLLNSLTENYNLTYDKAKRDFTLIMDEEVARNKVNEYKSIINNLGIVNIGAIEEYKRVKERYEFLINQKNDLFKAENTLLEIIKEMDEVMSSEFITTFKKIEVEFKNVFKELFGGGEAYLKLVDPDNILQTGIEISALPPGKKLTSISLLSGGEKALTAISLLFAILRVRPVPFSILDEVEAPLDEANVDIFGKFVKKMEDKTQFIIITHKKKTMEYANVLYGITMQESGVSKLVSVRLENIKEEH
ncbi:chromosome partition protein Smc [Clostridium sp. CAG:1193]|nr:chromosome partition protein Smc [Clostridium sp. CAG:1193]